MFLSPTDALELADEIRKLKRGKAPGMDDVPSSLIKDTCLYVRFARTVHGCKSLKIVGSKAWNEIPEKMKEAATLHSFKRSVKKYLTSTR